jgi:uncharacterized protein (TIGR02246 family)
MRLALALALVGALTGSAASSAAGQGSAADEAAIKALGASYAAAWNKGDAAALSNLYTADALDFGADGVMNIGRPAIVKAVAAALAAAPYKGSAIVINTALVSFLKPDIAIAHGTYTISSSGKAVVQGHWMGVNVKTAGGWQLRALEVLVPPPPLPAAGAPAKKKP